MRAGSGFYTHAIVAVSCQMDVRLSITIRQLASPRWRARVTGKNSPALSARR